MKPLEPPESYHLSAAIGWLGLGNWREANEELGKITPQLRAHSDVIEVRMEIYLKAEKWGLATLLAKALRDANPKEVRFWINLAYATRRCPPKGGLPAAKEILVQAQQKLPNEPTIPYNLACYECQLGDLKSAWKWLEKAFEVGDSKKLKLMALDDPDLEALWVDISEI